jgi:hypothetical protein
MSFRRFTSVLLLCLSAASTCAQSDRPHSFAIYRTAEIVALGPLLTGKLDWTHVKLAAVPLISDGDLVAYDFTNHVMTVKPEVFRRLPGSEVPFVVVADGERIYLGAFMAWQSSKTLCIPCIVPDAVRPPFDLAEKWNTLPIDDGFPPSYRSAMCTNPDPRSDERIRRALTALNKLK